MGNFTDRVGRRPGMIAGAALGMLSLGALAVHESLGVYVVAMGFFGIASAFLTVAPSAAVGDVVSGRGGTVVAAFQMAADLGAVIGPLLAGWLADSYSFSAAWGVSAGVMARRAGDRADLHGDASTGPPRLARARRRHHRLTGKANCPFRPLALRA